MKFRLFILSLLTLNFLLLAGLYGQSKPVEAPTAVLRARAIELVDSKGMARAQLQVEENGEVVFRLRDEEGSIRVKMGASKTGSGLLLLNGETEPGLQALARNDETVIRLLSKGVEREIKATGEK